MPPPVDPTDRDGLSRRVAARRRALGCLAEARPIFISGVYRSGTTFLTAVLNNFPNIQAASSTVKYLRFCVDRYGDLKEPAALARLLDETGRRVATRWGLALDAEAVRRHLDGHEPSHARLYDAIMRALLLDGAGGARRWGEKLAAQWSSIPDFLAMFPQGQVVHVFRDPRDLVASYKKLTYEPWPTHMDGALNAVEAMRALPALRRCFGEERLHLLRAEDLAADLAGETRRLAAFLGEPYSDELARLDRFADIKGEDWRRNSSFDGAGEGNYAAAAPRWAAHLSPAEAALIELICQPLMAAWGYAGGGGGLRAEDVAEIGRICADPWFGARLSRFRASGIGSEGYRTDPFLTEMRIVFPERYPAAAAG
jgi:hypothetical protein